ncbi:cyanophycinase [Corallincola platygyrae]|uniref:Cyanophycinase n=1 Tax=Corallincola platygyrae TaxID=1193278 RepID=A0ABW4XL96_9GAMM
MRPIASKMGLNALIFSFISLTLSATSVNAEESEYRLLLAGGGLATCSSIALKNCTKQGEEALSAVAAKTTMVISISSKSIDSLEVGRWWLPEREEIKRKWLALLRKMAVEAKTNQLPKRGFIDHIKASEVTLSGKTVKGRDLINQLTDAEWFATLDTLEVPQFRDGQRSQEVVALQYNKNPFSVEIYQQFIQMAEQVRAKRLGVEGQETAPRVGVVTASSRDPFEAVDFYTGVFAAAGAEAIWIPIDAALLATLSDMAPDRCEKLAKNRENILKSFNRAAIYPSLVTRQKQLCEKPERILFQLSQLDGLFFNGGDQSLTRAAFVKPDGSDSEWLALIRKRYEAGELALGGTSAGTAVMSGAEGQTSPVMISNGRSYAGLTHGAIGVAPPSARCAEQSCNEATTAPDALTYQPGGGLKFFPWGVMDTHFSERGRQGRLMRLASDTQSRWGVGVDEATALLVAPTKTGADFRVIGQGGVYWIDTATTERVETPRGLKLKQGISYYLTRDDLASMSLQSDLSVTFAPWKKPVAQESAISKRMTSEDVLEGSHYKQLAEAFCYSSSNKANGRSYKRDPEWWLTLEKVKQTKSSVAEVDVNGQKARWCSYQNLVVSFEPR